MVHLSTSCDEKSLCLIVLLFANKETEKLTKKERKTISKVSGDVKMIISYCSVLLSTERHNVRSKLYYNLTVQL